MLKVNDINVYYGAIHAIKGVSFEVNDGEVVTLYLDGEVALTARIPDMKETNFAFYSNKATAKIKDIKFYE